MFTCRSAHKLWLLYMIHLNPPSTCFLQISVPPSLRTHSYLPLIYLFSSSLSTNQSSATIFFFFFDFLSCLPACHTVCVCHLLFCCRESNDSECLSRFTFSSVVPLLHSLMSSVLLTNRCTMTALEEDHWFGPASLTCLCFSPMLLLFLFYFLRLIYLSQTAQAVASGWQAARATIDRQGSKLIVVQATFADSTALWEIHIATPPPHPCEEATLIHLTPNCFFSPLLLLLLLLCSCSCSCRAGEAVRLHLLLWKVSPNIGLTWKTQQVHHRPQGAMETRAATELKMDYFPLASVVAMNSLNVLVLGEARLFSGFFRVGSFVFVQYFIWKYLTDSLSSQRQKCFLINPRYTKLLNTGGYNTSTTHWSEVRCLIRPSDPLSLSSFKTPDGNIFQSSIQQGQLPHLTQSHSQPENSIKKLP